MRVTNAVASRKRRKRMIEAAKGFRLRRSKLYRYAKDAIEHGRKYAYRDRKNKKRTFRALWNLRINAAARDDELYAEATRLGLYEYTEELHPALEKSDAIYTDTWIDMEFFGESKFAGEKERRVELFQPYQLNRELLADLDLKILHCLPAHHGYEIEGALLHDERSLIFTQAENRLHSQKAVMLKLAGALS